jgi:hypothetical protein
LLENQDTGDSKENASGQFELNCSPHGCAETAQVTRGNGTGRRSRTPRRT